MLLTAVHGGSCQPCPAWPGYNKKAGPCRACLTSLADPCQLIHCHLVWFNDHGMTCGSHNLSWLGWHFAHDTYLIVCIQAHSQGPALFLRHVDHGFVAPCWPAAFGEREARWRRVCAGTLQEVMPNLRYQWAHPNVGRPMGSSDSSESSSEHGAFRWWHHSSFYGTNAGGVARFPCDLGKLDREAEVHLQAGDFEIHRNFGELQGRRDRDCDQNDVGLAKHVWPFGAMMSQRAHTERFAHPGKKVLSVEPLHQGGFNNI